MRESVETLEGVQQIPGREAQALVRWAVRWAKHQKFRPTAKQRARIRAFNRWYRKAVKIPHTVQQGGYNAERSRRGWVVRLSTISGRLRGHYLVPFRALRPHGRRWYGVPIFTALRRTLGRIDGAQRVNDRRFGAPTIWAGMP
jgi:hypothetical protein